jgi:hypothetical protein
MKGLINNATLKIALFYKAFNGAGSDSFLTIYGQADATLRT